MQTSLKAPPARARRLALLWLVVVVVIASYDGWLLTDSHLELDTDVLAMLPRNEREPAIQDATAKLADAGARRVVVLIGGAGGADAARSADAYANALPQSGADFTVDYRVDASRMDQWLEFYADHRGRLLTSEQRQMLKSADPQALAQTALESLYRPLSMPRVGSWADDPLKLMPAWLTARAGQSRVRVRDQRLVIEDHGRQFVLLTLLQNGAAFSRDAQRKLGDALAAAESAVHASDVNAQVIAVGIPLYAAAAARQAEHEIHTIGLGSLAGIVLLTWFAFSSIRPRLLVTLSILVGLGSALAACALIFGRVHVITIVFGASLVGVAENYGTNYFSNRLGRAPGERWDMLRNQAPVMWLAMLTTVIGYALLAITPFPGLRQFAVFSAIGLLSAFVTTLWWFPLLDTATMPTTRLAAWIGSRRALWPALGRNRGSLVFFIVLATIFVAGTARLAPDDDIRLLQNAPAELVDNQKLVNRLLDLPSPGQFFLVSGKNVEEVLEREEALSAKLDILVAHHTIAGYQTLSDWVPSISRQDEDLALIAQKVYGNAGVLSRVNAHLGQAQPGASIGPSSAPLRVSDWLAQPVSEPLRFLWLGQVGENYAGVVLLRGLEGAPAMAQLAALAPTLYGVRWVDKVAEISDIMGRYRIRMAAVILLSYVLVLGALARRFGKRAWRALLPTALASGLAISLQAILGEPLQLFNVLALLIILGMGVDYGIFLLETPGRDETRAFLSVSLAAASTLLAFGLLSLSATPALHAFGMTMLAGIGFAWLLTPLFMPTRGIERTKQPAKSQ